MDRPFPAYKGDEPYVFVSYSHSDSSAVFPELVWLKEGGFNVWYDEGIEPGTEWREEIAQAIEGCNLFLYFVTPASAASENCRKEVAFAMDAGLPILAVHLEPTELTGALRLSLSNRQALLKHQLSDADYRQKLLATVADFPDTEFMPEGRSRRFHLKLWHKGVAGFAILVALVAGVYFQKSPVVDEEVVSLHVAIEPFSTNGADDQLDFFAQRLVEDMSHEISKPKALELSTSITQIDENVQADYYIKGSVNHIAGEVTVSIQLFRASEQVHLWSDHYSQAYARMVSSSQMLSRKYAQLIYNRVQSDQTNLFFANSYPPWQTKALAPARDFFLKAEDQYTRWYEGSGGNRAVQLELLHKVIEIDPDFVWAYFKIANIYCDRVDLLIDHKTRLEKGRWAAAEAMRLADDQSRWGVLFFVGEVNLKIEQDYKTALQQFREGIRLNPSFGGFHLQIARIHLREGRRIEALDRIRQAAAIDSMIGNNIVLFSYGNMLMVNGQYQDAVAKFDDALALSAGTGLVTAFIHAQKAQALHLRGNSTEAKKSFDDAWKITGSIYPESFIPLLVVTGSPGKAKTLISQQEARYQSGHWVWPGNLFWGYYFLGDWDNAFIWLERAILERDESVVLVLRSAVYIEDLRLDLRYAEMEALLSSTEVHTDQYLDAGVK